MDARMFGLEVPLVAALQQLLDIPDGEAGDKAGAAAGGGGPTRTYVRDARAMAATPADVKELPGAYAFVVDMPGLGTGDIKVQVEDERVLVITGERRREEREDAKYLRMERRMGKFMRKFVLPDNADMDKIAAVCRDGVLTVTVEKLPPPEPKKPKTIEPRTAALRRANLSEIRTFHALLDSTPYPWASIYSQPTRAPDRSINSESNQPEQSIEREREVRGGEMDARMFGLEVPLAAALHHLLDVPDGDNKPGSAASGGPTRAYVRDARAMAATPADVKELPGAYAFVVDMPGLGTGDIKVQVEDERVLVITGERRREEREDAKYLRMERRMGKLMRQFVLPDNADVDKISAVCRDGVLTVTVDKLPPPEPKKPKTIEVKIA
ncbi:hypothetical protein U9M48_021043 [Paspalum notatum var. saurae]|uniref:SHSP domain-containing protein n=1 Tax=Paspalum notatum var. saurae TaxID=547442 RepID=A0AAQ3WSK9_PASNO